MLYGALPGTETGKLSVPHQNPGGPSPDGAAKAAVAGMSRIRARQAVSPPRVSHDRFMSPPSDRFVVLRPLYDGPIRLLVGRTGPALKTAGHSRADIRPMSGIPVMPGEGRAGRGRGG